MAAVRSELITDASSRCQRTNHLPVQEKLIVELTEGKKQELEAEVVLSSYF
jgi:hypothetical protein